MRFEREAPRVARWTLGLCFVLAVGAGCDGEMPEPDAFVPDPDGGQNDAGPDAGRRDAGADAGAVDAGVDAGGEADAGVDGGVDACMGSCGTEEACIRGVCIATCGEDISGFETDLGPGIVPVFNVCERAAAWNIRPAVGGGFVVLTADTAMDGMDTMVVVEERTLDAAGVETGVREVGRTPAIDLIGSFLNGYLPLNPTEDRVAVGFGAFDFPFAGDAFSIPFSGGMSEVIVSDENSFDAIFWSDTELLMSSITSARAHRTLLVDLSGPAPTTRNLFENVGDWSGSVERVGDFLYLGGSVFGMGGWPDGSSTVGRVFAIPAAAVDTALTEGATLQVFDAEMGASLSMGFREVLREDGAGTAPSPGTLFTNAFDGELALTEFGAAPATRTFRPDVNGEGPVVLRDEEVLATGSTFSGVVSVSDSLVALTYTFGTRVLLVERVP